jgi:hypothetical protein
MTWLTNPHRYSETLLNDLVAWWSLDEESGTRYDAHGSLDLTDNNSCGFISGKQGNAADYISVNNEWMTNTSASILAGRSSNWSIAFWIRVDSSSPAYAIISSHNAVRTGIDWAVNRHSSNQKLFFQIREEPTRREAYSQNTLSINTWYHVYCDYDHSAQEMRMIVDDGTPYVTSTSAITTPDAVGTEISFGKGVVADYFSGNLDEVAFWDRKLTAAEVSRLYASGAGISYDDIQSTYWSYASLSAAESSGDAWADGDDVVIIGGAHFVYKSALAVDGYSGLIHKYPWDGTGTLGTLSALEVNGSEAVNVDPDSWTGWTDTSTAAAGDYEFDTNAGRARIENTGSFGIARTPFNTVPSAGDEAIFNIIDDVDTSIGGTPTYLIRLFNYAYVDGANDVMVEIVGSGDSTTTNWQIAHGASGTTLTTSTVSRTAQHRLFMYVKSGRWAFWADDEATPNLSGNDPRIIAAAVSPDYMCDHSSGSGTRLQLGANVHGNITTS